jgi:hypothetical protein
MSDEEDGPSNGDDDPFEQLEADVDGREGDPFENLSGSGTAGEEPPTGMGPEDTGSDSGAGQADPESEQPEPQEANDDWVDEFGVQPGTADGATAGSSGSETGEAEGGSTSESRSGPDSDEMGLDVGRRTDATADPLGDVGDREGDPFEEGGSLFEERDTESIDPDTVWQELASADSQGATGDAYERTFAEVSKHSYCEQCEHFSGPPEVACTHEGTDIVEFLDMETVRVVDCPIVAERKELEEDS